MASFWYQTEVKIFLNISSETILENSKGNFVIIFSDSQEKRLNLTFLSDSQSFKIKDFIQVNEDFLKTIFS